MEEELRLQEDLTIGDTMGRSQKTCWRAYVLSTCLIMFVGLQFCWKSRQDEEQ